MMDDVVIDIQHLFKGYSLEPKPGLRLWRQLTGTNDRGPQHHALYDINLRVRRGEAVGIMGRNGAGKSTLLQLICGVLQPTRGTRMVKGRVAALLELGAGFNPELTGRENVRLNGPLLGMSGEEMERHLPGIIEFAGIGSYIDQPVRSYSSGMFMRLAFSMATSVEPDILVIDEALSVGDGLFARKSFERIMALKERGATVLLCSHSLFQLEALCPRALWINDGRIQFDGPSRQAAMEYNEWLSKAEMASKAAAADAAASAVVTSSHAAAITRVSLPGVDGPLRSGVDSLTVRIEASTHPDLPCPSFAVVIHSADGRVVTSVGSWLDPVALQRASDGFLAAAVKFPCLPLLKGRYTVSVYVLCDRGINVYVTAEQIIGFDVVQDDLRQGVVALPHEWEQGT